MQASFYLPVRVLFGRGVIMANPSYLTIGKKAMIVTGRNGARASGALDDVTRVLDGAGVAYVIFDRVTENPPILTCLEGGALAAREGVDFVIGIGGGSPLDAAKAIAAFATNPTLSAKDLYDDAKRIHPTLPLVAVPTTAGTGSEANPYSVLTLPDGERKKTFKAADTWFRTAFVDPCYTESLSRETTISTALDAFAHALESYLSPKSSAFSEGAALFAAARIWDVLSQSPATFSPEMRDDLMAASCAAGMAISVTGTGFPHPLGYSLTLLDGVPHGRACAAFAADYIDYNEKAEQGKARIATFAEAIGATPRVMKALLTGLSDVSFSFTEQEIARRVELVKGAGNYTNSPYVLSVEEMYDIYRRLFLKKK
ncbi:MAG: iron-containing alcohol dehydrogenase [Clostridia bacterium]|nr:iron-containing alcohol dehydrogenase [Clostridia bacterium]